MAWLRIDDRVRTHPKIAEAGPAAAWLWFCGICYCREHLTGYKCPRDVMFRDDLPKSNVGKILRRELREIARKELI